MISARTNIVLDDALVARALKVSRARSERELIHNALVGFVENHNRKNLLNLKGKIRFQEDFDYKAIRDMRKV